MHTQPECYGAVELGGTHVRCALGQAPPSLSVHEQFPTGRPEETLSHIIRFFRDQTSDPVALGVASFGPLQLHRGRPDYGHILQTPKPSWSGTDLIGPLQDALQIPVLLETDVNAAAIAEHTWGAAQGVHSVLYLTVGTGIGGGYRIDGSCMHGHLHPEMGHVSVPRASGDSFKGSCPYHDHCLEGMASGAAIAERWDTQPELLPVDHAAWDLQVHYLSHGLASLSHVLSPERIVLGGGVMSQDHLYGRIRTALKPLLNDYLPVPPMATFVARPGLDDRSGLLGALALARTAGRKETGSGRSTPKRPM